MTIFAEIDKAASALVRRGVEPKFVVLTPEQIKSAMVHPDAPRWITYGPGWLVKIVGLPYCVLQDYDGPMVMGVPYPRAQRIAPSRPAR